MRSYLLNWAEHLHLATEIQRLQLRKLFFLFSFKFYFDHKKKKKVGLSLVGELQQCHILLFTTWLGFFECKPTISPTTAASTFTFLQTQSSAFPYRVPGLFLLALNCVSQRQLLPWCRILDNKPSQHLSFSAWHTTWAPTKNRSYNHI